MHGITDGFVGAVNFNAVNFNGSFIRIKQPLNTFNQNRFAGSGTADDNQRFAFFDFNIHAVENNFFAKSLMQIFYLNFIFAHFFFLHSSYFAKKSSVMM